MNLPKGTLTTESTLEIKKLLWEGELSQSEIATRFALSQPTVSRIYRGKDWQSIEWPDGSTGAIPLDRHIQLKRDRKKGPTSQPPEHESIQRIAKKVADSVGENLADDNVKSIVKNKKVGTRKTGKNK